MLSNRGPVHYRSRSVSVTSILDDAFSLLRQGYRLLFGIAAILMVPCTLLVAILPDRIAPDYQAHARRVSDLSDQMQRGIAVSNSTWTNAITDLAKDGAKVAAVVGSITLLQVSLLGCALAVAVCQRYLDRETTVAECYRVAVHRFGKVILSMLAIVVILGAILVVPVSAALLIGSGGLGLLLFLVSCIVVIVLAVRFSLYMQVVAIEGYAIGSLRRSMRLTDGYFWKTVGLLLLTTILVGIVNVLTSTTVTHLTNDNEIIVTLVSLAISVATMPLILCAQTLLYLDIRAKEEGLTPEGLASELDALRV